MLVEVKKFGNGKVRMEVTLTAKEAEDELHGWGWVDEARYIACQILVSPERWKEASRRKTR